MNDVNSLSHTSWNCKYHIVFAPKYRRKVFYGQKRKEIGEILRKLCEWKKVTIIEAEVSCEILKKQLNSKDQLKSDDIQTLIAPVFTKQDEFEYTCDCEEQT